jgi:hypothetical protein
MQCKVANVDGTIRKTRIEFGLEWQKAHLIRQAVRDIWSACRTNGHGTQNATHLSINTPLEPTQSETDYRASPLYHRMKHEEHWYRHCQTLGTSPWIERGLQSPNLNRTLPLEMPSVAHLVPTATCDTHTHTQRESARACVNVVSMVVISQATVLVV